MILYFFRKQKKSKELKYVFICQLTSIISDISISFIRKSNNSLSGFSSNFFTIIALLVLLLLFYTILSSYKSRKIILVSAITLGLYLLFQLFIKSHGDSFNSINVAILAILIIIWSIVFFYEQLTKPAIGEQLFLYSSPSFWIVSAYLIYFAGTFFLFIYSQNKPPERDTEEFIQYSLINGVFILIKNILLSVAMFTRGSVESKPAVTYINKSY